MNLLRVMIPVQNVDERKEENPCPLIKVQSVSLQPASVDTNGGCFAVLFVSSGDAQSFHTGSEVNIGLFEARQVLLQRIQ